MFKMNMKTKTLIKFILLQNKFDINIKIRFIFMTIDVFIKKEKNNYVRINEKCLIYIFIALIFSLQ